MSGRGDFYDELLLPYNFSGAKIQQGYQIQSAIQTKNPLRGEDSSYIGKKVKQKHVNRPALLFSSAARQREKARFCLITASCIQLLLCQKDQ